MPSHAPKLAPLRKSCRLAGDDSDVTLVAEALEYISKEKEYESGLGPGSPAPGPVKDDGTKGILFMVNLLAPLLAQAIVGQSCLNPSLDSPIELSNSISRFGDFNLDADRLLKVQTVMLTAVWSVKPR
jgi:hypothetical protein